MPELKRFVNVNASVEIIVEVPVDCESVQFTNGLFLMHLDEAVRKGRWVHAANPKVTQDRTEEV